VPATPIEPTTLTGRFIRLEPLSRSDLPELYDALSSPEVYSGGWGGGPAGFKATREEFVQFGQDAFVWETSIVYGVRTLAGELIGTSSLRDFDLKREHTHIGATAYHPGHWGGPVNPEAKLLMLGTAFDHGFGRVKLQADILNDRSRAAILKLGATFEGIKRRDMLRADGTWRDSAIYSILVDEWPSVRAGLEARLANFG
jgi:RimJ/RimL family protein N-acetyltransferase